jgi:hypothetical protein
MIVGSVITSLSTNSWTKRICDSSNSMKMAGDHEDVLLVKP